MLRISLIALALFVSVSTAESVLAQPGVKANKGTKSVIGTFAKLPTGNKFR